jgi:hypothetical protein
MVSPNDPDYIVNIQTHIYKRENDKLKAIAKKRGITKQRLISLMIKDFVEREG